MTLKELQDFKIEQMCSMVEELHDRFGKRSNPMAKIKLAELDQALTQTISKIEKCRKKSGELNLYGRLQLNYALCLVRWIYKTICKYPDATLR